jgi:small-conductance mechanosensitive channel
MDAIWSSISAYLSSTAALNIFYAILKVIIGLLAARLGSRALVRMFSEQASEHHAAIIRRISFYAIMGLFIASALSDLEVDLSVLLGAAGILTVAIGFASQTSASNIISGLFLLGEKPFAIGDVVKIGTTTGEVLSIDLLSVKLRTFDNLFVRVPNENIIKSEITNNTRFPIRRIDLQLGVAYKEDLKEVQDVLMRVAEGNPLCLTEPAPLFIFTGFGDSALTFQFSIWGTRQNFLQVRNTIQEDIKDAFDAAGIEMPFPHRTLYAGSVTDPFPIRLVSEEGKEPTRQTEPYA